MNKIEHEGIGTCARIEINQDADNADQHMNKIDYEGMGTCVRIEKSQDADNADQKVKWFMKVYEHENF